MRTKSTASPKVPEGEPLAINAPRGRHRRLSKQSRVELNTYALSTASAAKLRKMADMPDALLEDGAHQVLEHLPDHTGRGKMLAVAAEQLLNVRFEIRQAGAIADRADNDDLVEGRLSIVVEQRSSSRIKASRMRLPIIPRSRSRGRRSGPAWCSAGSRMRVGVKVAVAENLRQRARRRRRPPDDGPPGRRPERPPRRGAPPRSTRE